MEECTTSVDPSVVAADLVNGVESPKRRMELEDSACSSANHALRKARVTVICEDGWTERDVRAQEGSVAVASHSVRSGYDSVEVAGKALEKAVEAGDWMLPDRDLGNAVVLAYSIYVKVVEAMERDDSLAGQVASLGHYVGVEWDWQRAGA